jgi:hypothetical protein
MIVYSKDEFYIADPRIGRIKLDFIKKLSVTSLEQRIKVGGAQKETMSPMISSKVTRIQ